MYSYNLEVHPFLPCDANVVGSFVISPVGGCCDDVHDVTFQVVCVAWERAVPRKL